MIPERRLRELLVRAWNHSPFYREVFTREGIRERDLPYVALEHLPVVSKADVMVRFDEAVTDRRLRLSDLKAWVEQDTDPLNLYLDEYIVVHSSGGSKIYSYVPHTRKAWRYLTATAAPQLLPFTQGMERPLRSAFFMKPQGHFVGATSISLASQAAHEVLRLSIFDPVEEIWARLNAFQPERVSSYASTLVWLAEWTLQGRLRIAPRSVLVSGDRLTRAMRAQIKKAWNAEIYDLYAGAESLYIAARRPGNDEFHVFTDLNLLEVVDATNRMVRPGERGRVLLTSLVHTTLPIIRFDLRDFAVLGKAGLGAETLLSLDGKVHDALPIRLANGGTAALEVHELAQIELPGVEKMQFVHRSPVDVEIRYQSQHDLDTEIDGAFRRLLAQKSASMETLKVQRVERILNSRATLKLRVVTPDQETITPTSLLVDHVAASLSPSIKSVGASSLFAEADLTGSIDRRFSQIALRYPEHPAAIDGETQLRFGELHRRATQVSGELLRRGFDPARPVAVLCGHALELLPLILGVMRAGGFYVPLDPYLPTGRLKTILADARPEFVLASAAQREAAATLAADQHTVLCLDDMEALPRQGMPTIAPAAPACLLYTSGTTGSPKGVVLSHAAVLARAARYAADYGLSQEDRLSLLQSFAVSAGIREIYGALLTGATLMFYDIRARGLGELAHWLQHAGITVFYAVPTIFRLFLETLTDESFPRVRVVRLGGEPVREDDVSGFRRHFRRGCILANGYAATETDTICQTFIDHDTRIVAGRVPAGTSVPGVEVTLWDERGEPATGAVGEIRVAGTMVASGYWDARSGQVQPFDLPMATGDLGYQLDDGRVFLAGRRDLIVNVHGYRIHLGEIERAVSRVAGVVEAVAVPRPAAQGDTTVAVYYVAQGESGPDATELRQAVAAVIPKPAEPTSYVKLPALPRLPGGKVNRSSLITQSSSGPPAVAPEPIYASALERRLAHLWRDVLEIPAPTREANFFDLGGDSVSVYRVLNHIEIEFGVELSVSDFFSRPVLAELAHAVEQLRTGSADHDPPSADSKADPETLPLPAKPAAVRTASFVAPRSPTEHQIAAIWEDFFRVSPIGAHDNYFDLGGDAASAAALVATIEENCGTVLSPSVLLQAPTVAGLAAAMTRVESGFNEPITALRPSGQRSPLFFLHNDYGRGLYTHALARCLDSDRPFYAVHLHGLNEPECPATLEAIAASRIQAVRGARPHGPYVLGGHCDGGLIALEMARQLQEAGEHVELVVMVDTDAPSRGSRTLRRASNTVSRLRGRIDRIRGPIAWRLRYYKTRLEMLRRAGVRSQTDYVLRKLMGLARPVTAALDGHPAGSEGALENAMRSDFTESRRAHRQAVRHYVPPRYTSPVVLFRAEQLPAYRPDLGWSKLLPRLEVAVIPGDHHTCITRHVDAFGARLNEILRRVDTVVQYPVPKSSSTRRKSRAERPAQGSLDYRASERSTIKTTASGKV